jgi:transcriptional regulator with XRE-family HTH domain
MSPEDTPHARLKAARLAAGFASAARAAEHFGFTVPTYNAHENGQNGINVDVAKEYANAFNTTAEWLLLGKVEGVSIPIANKPVELDPLLIATWQKLSVKQRKKLMQIALIISEE